MYDEYHEAELARPDLDVYLPRLYRCDAALIALFLCPEYVAKQWCRLEWRQVRQLVTTADQGRVMLLSFGDPGELSELGMSEGDGYLEIGNRTADVIAAKICERLRVNQDADHKAAVAAACPPGDAVPRPSPLLDPLTEQASLHGLVRVRYQTKGATEHCEILGYQVRVGLVLTLVPPASGANSLWAFAVGCSEHEGFLPAESVWSGELLQLLEAAPGLVGDADASSPLCGWPDPTREVNCCVLLRGPDGAGGQACGVLQPSEAESPGRRHLTLSDAKPGALAGAPVFCGGRLAGLVGSGPSQRGYPVELVKPLLRDPAFAAKIGWLPPSSLLAPLLREMTQILEGKSELVVTLGRELELEADGSVETVASELLWVGAEKVLGILCYAMERHPLSADEPRPGPVRRLMELVLPFCFDWAAPVAEIEGAHKKETRVVKLAASRQVLCELVMAGGTGRRAFLEVLAGEVIGSGSVVAEGGRDTEGSQLLRDILVHLARKLRLLDDESQPFDRKQLERLRDDVLAGLQLREDLYRRRRGQGIQSFDTGQPLYYVVTSREQSVVGEVAARLPGVCIVRRVPGAGMGRYEAFLQRGIQQIIELDNQPAKAT